MKVCLLKLFLMSGSKQYARSLICDLLIITHQHQVDHPIFRLSEADPHCFNEEPGEISLSVLARLNLGMTDKRSLKVMGQRYRMSKAAMLLAHYLNPRMRKRLIPSRTKKYTIKPEGAEVNATISFFRSMIDACVANQHQMVQISGRRSVKTRSGMNSSLLTASQLPIRKWWNTGEVEEKFDQQIEHIRVKWLDKPYCTFSRPWFEDDLVAKVRDHQSKDEDWHYLFALVPEALSSDDPDDDIGGSGNSGNEDSPSDDDEGSGGNADEDESLSTDSQLGNSNDDVDGDSLPASPAGIPDVGEERVDGKSDEDVDDLDDETGNDGDGQGSDASSDISGDEAQFGRDANLRNFNSVRPTNSLKRRRSQSPDHATVRQEEPTARQTNVINARRRSTRQTEKGYYRLLSRFGSQH